MLIHTYYFNLYLEEVVEDLLKNHMFKANPFNNRETILIKLKEQQLEINRVTHLNRF